MREQKAKIHDLRPVVNKSIQIILASSSKLFLEGIREILEDEGDIQVTAMASSYEEITKYLAEIKPEFLFLDNKTLKLDTHELLKLVIEKSPNTKVILLDSHAEDEPALPDVIYVTRKTSSSELIHSIKTY